MGIKKLFLYLFVGSIGVSALIGIAILIFGNFGEFEVRVLLTALTVTVTSILGLACGAFLETGRQRAIPLIGIALAVISGVMWMFVVWLDGNRGDVFVRSLLSITIVAAACAHISLISLARLDAPFRWLRIAAHATVWPLAALLVVLIWNSSWMEKDVWGRIVGIVSILVGAVTVMTPIFHWLSSAEPTAEAIDIEIAKLTTRIDELRQMRSAMHTE